MKKGSIMKYFGPKTEPWGFSMVIPNSQRMTVMKTKTLDTVPLTNIGDSFRKVFTS